MRRVGILLILAVIAELLVAALPARACSCALGDPRRTLIRSDAAFIGTLLNRGEPESNDQGAVSTSQNVTWTFRVERIVKGNLGHEVDVESPGNGAACGFEVQRGQRIGVFLQHREGLWHGGICSQVNPDVLLQAAKPLPVPDGTGSLAFMLGVAWGEARLLGLDRSGKTLAYGLGNSETIDLSLCPGAHKVVELTHEYQSSGWMQKFEVRDLGSFKVEKEFVLKQLGITKSPIQQVQALTCRNEAGTDLLFVVNNDEDPITRGQVLRFQGGKKTVLYEGELDKATFVPNSNVAYISAGENGRVIQSLNLETGTHKMLVTLPQGRLTNLSVSPMGKQIAGVSFSPPLSGDSPPSRLFLVEVANGKLHEDSLDKFNIGGEMLWVNENRLVFVPEGEGGSEVRVYDNSLIRKSNWSGWESERSIVSDGLLFGVLRERSRLVFASADPLGGGVKELRRFETPYAYALVALPPNQQVPKQATPIEQLGTSPSPVETPRSTDIPVEEVSRTYLPISALVLLVLASGGWWVWRRRMSRRSIED